MTITSCNQAAPTSEIIDVLRRDGVVIIENLIPAPDMGDLVQALEPDLEAQEIGGGAFFGYRRRGVAALFARGPELSRTLLMNPTVIALADAVLKPSCDVYQVHASGVMQVWGGGSDQPLHREIDIYAPYLNQDPSDDEYVVFFMFAGSDFTKDNGATRLVPGSHRWPVGRKPNAAEVDQAVMPQGSLVAWLGRTLHGLGASTSDEPRTGVGFSLSVGWLRQEENQYIAVPPETAAQLDPEVQQLLGYRVHGPLVGWVEGRQHDNVLQPAS